MLSDKAFRYIESNNFLLKEDKFKEFFDKCNDYYLKRELAEFLIIDCDVRFLDYMKSIPNHLFYKSSRLTELEIPKSIVEIEDNVFENCRSLKNINMPNSINKIGENVFYGCIALLSVNIPNSVIDIGHNSFYGCNNLKEINIPKSLNGKIDLEYIGIDENKTKVI